MWGACKTKQSVQRRSGVLKQGLIVKLQVVQSGRTWMGWELPAGENLRYGQEPSVSDHAMGFEFHSKRNYEPLKGFKERVPLIRYMF